MIFSACHGCDQIHAIVFLYCMSPFSATSGPVHITSEKDGFQFYCCFSLKSFLKCRVVYPRSNLQGSTFWQRSESCSQGVILNQSKPTPLIVSLLVCL